MPPWPCRRGVSRLVDPGFGFSSQVGQRGECHGVSVKGAGRRWTSRPARGCCQLRRRHPRHRGHRPSSPYPSHHNDPCPPSLTATPVRRDSLEARCSSRTTTCTTDVTCCADSWSRWTARRERVRAGRGTVLEGRRRREGRSRDKQRAHATTAARTLFELPDAHRRRHTVGDRRSVAA
jgi:hypothetical protein